MEINNQSNKQKLLIEYLISSPDTFAICKGIVRSDYFHPEYRQVVDFMHEYYDEYHTTPNVDQILGETNLTIRRHVITKDQIDYCANEIEKFCRKQALRQAIRASAALVDSDDGGAIETMIRDAISVSLSRDLGLDYFARPLERLQKMSKTPQRTPTMWREMDRLLGGGLSRTEMLLFSANSGGGKSITLGNLALNFLMQGLNVMYISLELSESMIGQRFDTMFTGIPSVNWLQNYEKIADELRFISDQLVTDQEGNAVPAGNLNIKHMSTGSTSSAIRSYIKEFHLRNGFVPDLLVVDYLDLMGANEHVSADNISEKDKLAAEQLRDVGFDFNMFIATASQQNRSAIDAKELNQSHIAGGLTKVNTVDWYVSIIMNPILKAAGGIDFFFLKSRSSDAVGKRFSLKWDNQSLRILNLSKDLAKPNDAIQEKIAQLKRTPRVGMNDLLSFGDTNDPSAPF